MRVSNNPPCCRTSYLKGIYVKGSAEPWGPTAGVKRSRTWLQSGRRQRGLLKKQLALRAMQASLPNHLRDASHWHSSPAHKRRPIVHFFSFHMPISHPRSACTSMHGTGISKVTLLSSYNPFLSRRKDSKHCLMENALLRPLSLIADTAH